MEERIYIVGAHSRAQTLAVYLQSLQPGLSEDIVGLVHYRRHFILPEDWVDPSGLFVPGKKLF